MRTPRAAVAGLAAFLLACGCAAAGQSGRTARPAVLAFLHRVLT